MTRNINCPTGMKRQSHIHVTFIHGVTKYQLKVPLKDWHNIIEQPGTEYRNRERSYYKKIDIVAVGLHGAWRKARPTALSKSPSPVRPSYHLTCPSKLQKKKPL